MSLDIYINSLLNNLQTRMWKKNFKKWNLKSTKIFHKLTSNQQLWGTGLPESRESGKFFSRCTKYNAVQYLLLFGIPELSRSKRRGASIWPLKFLQLTNRVPTETLAASFLYSLYIEFRPRTRKTAGPCSREEGMPYIGDISFRCGWYFHVKYKMFYAAYSE